MKVSFTTTASSENALHLIAHAELFRTGFVLVVHNPLHLLMLELSVHKHLEQRNHYKLYKPYIYKFAMHIMCM